MIVKEDNGNWSRKTILRQKTFDILIHLLEITRNAVEKI